MSTIIVYLDEFGHEGPYISRNHPKHNTCPIFGMGGFWLPVAQVRQFSSWFYQLKCRLLDFEIRRDGAMPYIWEKKGSSLYTTQNVTRYQELRKATFRIINKISRSGGRIFYVGVKKDPPQDCHSSKRLFRSVLREAIKRIDQFCAFHQSQFFMILDEKEQSFRYEIVQEAAMQMYGSNPRKSLVEPPIQAESHLFQTLQCADWLCGLIGRVGTYEVCSEEYPELEWTKRYFRSRLFASAPNSGIRK